jgi:hypothetical protein
VFKSVQTIIFPTSIFGIEIFVEDDMKIIESLVRKFSFKINIGYRIFGIRNKEGQIFYLNGSVFGVFNNKLDILESSLGDFMWSSKNSLIYWSDDL